MNILLVQSYLGRHEPGGAVFPLGLCYIASRLKGHNVKVFDPNVSQSPFIELEEEIKAFKPEVVGISLRNIDTTQKRDIFYYYKTLEPTVQLVKRVDPGVKVMIGGAGFSMFARKIMERIPELDFGIYLEGDESVPELLAKLNNPGEVKGIFLKKGDNIIFTGQRHFPDTGKLAIPRRDFVDIRRYDDPVYTNIGIQTKRGCPLKCAYCSYPFLNGCRMRVIPVKQSVDEIEYMVNELNIKRFMFTDSTFNLPEGHAEEICKEIIKRGIKAEWSAWFDVKRFSEELLTLSIKAGCKNFSFSPDAASNDSLEALGKDIVEQDISRVIGMLRKTKGVRVEFHLFCTPPRQNFSGFLKTLLLFLKVSLIFMRRGAVHLGWIRIEPETRIYEMAIDDGVISEETELLPMSDEGFSRLFYSCPATRWYADPIFNFIMYARDNLKPLLKKTFGRKAA